MRTFTDNAGQVWTVSVNVFSIQRVRDLLHVDLCKVIEGGELLTGLTTDPVLLCNVVYCLCKSEADQRGVTDEQFGRAMGGDALDGATMALLEDLADFFPKSRREVLRRVMAKLRTVESRVVAAVEKRLESPELNAELEKQLGSLFGPVPAS